MSFSFRSLTIEQWLANPSAPCSAIDGDHCESCHEDEDMDLHPLVEFEQRDGSTRSVCCRILRILQDRARRAP